MLGSNIKVVTPHAQPSEQIRFPPSLSPSSLSLSLSLPLPLSLSPLPAPVLRWLLSAQRTPGGIPVHESDGEAVGRLREPQSLPPFTRAWLSIITLALRALGSNHTVSAPCEGTTLLCEVTLRWLGRGLGQIAFTGAPRGGQEGSAGNRGVDFGVFWCLLVPVGVRLRCYDVGRNGSECCCRVAADVRTNMWLCLKSYVAVVEMPEQPIAEKASV